MTYLIKSIFVVIILAILLWAAGIPPFGAILISLINIALFQGIREKEEMIIKIQKQLKEISKSKSKK